MKTKQATPKAGAPVKPVPELKTDAPISEKDEVKKAEDRSRATAKKKF